MLDTVDDIVAAIGGNKATAKLCGVGLSAISMWRQRGMIPPDHWHVMTEELRRKRKKVDPAVFFRTALLGRPGTASH
jgi:hypothetical protein